MTASSLTSLYGLIYVLLITTSSPAEITKTVLLKPSTIATSTGVTLSLGPSITIINDQWDINVKTQQGSDISLSMDSEWGFHPLYPSTISFIIDGNTSLSSYHDDGDILFVFSVANQHFSEIVSIDSRRSAYKQCPITNDPLIIRDVTEMITSIQPQRYYRFCENSVTTHVDDVIDYWINHTPQYKAPGQWPMLLSITNDPVLNTISYSWTDDATNTPIKVFSQYITSFATDQGVNMYISGDNLNENFFIFSIDISYTYTTPPIPTPTSQPTINTLHPSNHPTSLPTTTNPTVSPTPAPTTHPTRVPTSNPTLLPTNIPTTSPTNIPTVLPTSNPTLSPTLEPTVEPTSHPSIAPTPAPTLNPTVTPTNNPSTNPTKVPTSLPSVDPTIQPTTNPTLHPSNHPTVSPTNLPTKYPSINPTESPTNNPTPSPTLNPTPDPTLNPTPSPTTYPTHAPTVQPSPLPTNAPITPGSPTVFPTISTANPSVIPTPHPSDVPTVTPTHNPTQSPSNKPTFLPTKLPTISPSNDPSTSPTISPSYDPTKIPSMDPTLKPSNNPSIHPTTVYPSSNPTPCPIMMDSLEPTERPTPDPTVNPSDSPSNIPTGSVLTDISNSDAMIETTKTLITDTKSDTSTDIEIIFGVKPLKARRSLTMAAFVLIFMGGASLCVIFMVTTRTVCKPNGDNQKMGTSKGKEGVSDSESDDMPQSQHKHEVYTVHLNAGALSDTDSVDAYKIKHVYHVHPRPGMGTDMERVNTTSDGRYRSRFGVFRRNTIDSENTENTEKQSSESLFHEGFNTGLDLLMDTSESSINTVSESTDDKMVPLDERDNMEKFIKLVADKRKSQRYLMTDEEIHDETYSNTFIFD